MAGCGTCPDQCGCVIVDESYQQYSGSGTADDPIIIPRAHHLPYGITFNYYGSVIPPDYMLAHGQFVNIFSNPNTFAVIGHSQNGGVDPGNGTFRLPDERGRVVAGLDNMGGINANRVTDPQADVIGGVLGSASMALTINDLPAHRHLINDPGHSHTSSAISITIPGHSHSVNDPGHSHTVNNGVHSHSIDDPGHGHSINDPGHSHIADNDGEHNHFTGSGSGRGFVTFQNPINHVAVLGGGVVGVDPSIVVSGGGVDIGNQTNNGATNNTGVHSHAININTSDVSVNNGFTNITSTNNNTDAVSVNSGSTGITIASAGSGTFSDTPMISSGITNITQTELTGNNDPMSNDRKLQPTIFANKIMRRG